MSNTVYGDNVLRRCNLADPWRPEPERGSGTAERMMGLRPADLNPNYWQRTLVAETHKGGLNCGSGEPLTSANSLILAWTLSSTAPPGQLHRTMSTSFRQQSLYGT
jgi:hypothetical protein